MSKILQAFHELNGLLMMEGFDAVYEVKLTERDFDRAYEDFSKQNGRYFQMENSDRRTCLWMKIASPGGYVLFTRGYQQ